MSRRGAAYVLALDQGTTSSRAIAFDRAGRPRRQRASGSSTQHLPVHRDTWSTTRTRSGQGQLACAREVVAAIGGADRDRGDRRDRAARDDRGLGARQRGGRWRRPSCGRAASPRPAARPCGRRVTRPASGISRAFRWTPTSRPPRSPTCSTRHAGPARSSRGRRARRRDGRRVARLEPDRRPGARHRRLERLADARCWTSGASPGTRGCARCSTCPWACCPRVVSSSGVVAETDPGVVRARHPHRGHRGRPAGGHLRAGVLSTEGDAKNTYGTGAFLLRNAGTEPVPSAGWLADHRPVATRAMASRRCTPSRDRCSSRAPRCSGCETGCAPSTRRRTWSASRPGIGHDEGVYLVPAFTGLGAPVVGSGGARDCSSASRAGRGCRTSHARPSTPSPTRCATCSRAWTRTPGSRSSVLRVDGGAARNDDLLAVPGRPPGGPGRATGRDRDHRRRSGLPGGHRRGLLVRARRGRSHLEARPALRAHDVRARAGAAGRGDGGAPSSAASAGR